MNNVQLSSDVIIGLNWDETQEVKAVLRVVPINLYGAVDTDNIVFTGGKNKTYPFPAGKFAKNALLYSEYPRGMMPGADKALIKMQFDGIPNTVSALIFVFEAVDAEDIALPAKRLKRIPAWCATPTTAMDVIGSGGKLGVDDLMSYISDDHNVAVPLEVVRTSEEWVVNALPNGYRKYADALESLGFEDPDKKRQREIEEQREKERLEKELLEKLEAERQDKERLEKEQREKEQREKEQQDKESRLKVQRQKDQIKKLDSKAATKLITGQRTAIPDGEKHITVTLNVDAPFKPDMSAFILDGATRPKAVAEQLIFYNQPEGAGGAVVYDEGSNSLDFDLNNIPSDINTIAVVLSIDEQTNPRVHFGQAKKLTATFKSSTEVFLYELELKSGTQFKAVDMCDVYRKNGKWKFNAKGAGVNGGLAALCDMYGVDVN